jgi:ACT domain-containing protein
MSLSDYEIRRITQIVAGQVGDNLDAKEIRKVIDSVMDNLNNANPDIKGVTCDVPSDNKIDKVQTGRSVAQEPVTEAAGLYQQIEQTDKSRVIIAAFGKNRPGVVASITNILAELNCSIEDISQTLMQEFFSMIMIVDMKDSSIDFASLKDKIQSTEAVLGMKVYIMHEDIFRYMHRI